MQVIMSMVVIVLKESHVVAVGVIAVRQVQPGHERVRFGDFLAGLQISGMLDEAEGLARTVRTLGL